MTPTRKKLLIAGGGYADIPLIQAAKALGFYVITSGNRADDLGHRYSDECRLEDFSDPQAMLKLAQLLRIDAICACCNDFSALSSAYVAEQMSLPGHDPVQIARIVHHKDQYRAFAQQHDIPSPKASGFDSVQSAVAALDDFCFPVIVKPVDLTGGKGITKVSVPAEARQALETAFAISRAKRVVVEEFLEGSRHGLSSFVRDGKLVFYFHDDEYYFKNPYLVSAASAPGSVPPAVVHQLCKTIERFVALLNLITGIVHVQYILDKDSVPVMIEICRRAPGDLYLRLVQHATGIDYAAYIVRAAAGLDCGELKQTDCKGFFTRHCIMAPTNGRVQDIIYYPSIQEFIIERFEWWRPGDIIQNYLVDKLGILFLQFPTFEDMRIKTEQMHDLVCVHFSDLT